MTDLRLTATDRTVKFTDREVRLIIASLHDEIDDRGCELLPMVLRDWAATDLREYFTQEPREAQARRIEGLETIALCWSKAADELERLDQRGLIGLRMTIAEKWSSADADVVDLVCHPLGMAPGKLRWLAASACDAAKIWKRNRGRPRNLAGYLILLDIAAIFEWLTGADATRIIERTEGIESGLFWDFASAVWMVIYGSDYGLSHGLKSWAELRNKYSERSRLIDNMDLRNPEWRIFED